MSGVWVFEENGVYRRVENRSAAEQQDGRQGNASGRRTALVYLASGEVVSSFTSLERILTSLGWERYYGGGSDLFQFHKQSGNDLISLPRDFSRFSSVHMYDIVIKNPNVFHVREI